MREIVKDFKINKKITVNELIKQMKDSGGFTAKKLAVSIEIIESIFLHNFFNFNLSFSFKILWESYF